MFKTRGLRERVLRFFIPRNLRKILYVDDLKSLSQVEFTPSDVENPRTTIGTMTFTLDI